VHPRVDGKTGLVAKLGGISLGQTIQEIWNMFYTTNDEINREIAQGIKRS
jgi:hypothetical protein